MTTTLLYPESKCINCCACLDLEDKENNQLPSLGGFFTLNCTSRVRFPLSPASIQEIPVGRALSTIFNLKPRSSSKQDNSNNNVNDNDSDSDHDDESSLFLLLEDSPSLPICFVCHLVLNDLYRTYTEFSQLRKSNSFLGGKLAELENTVKENRNQNLSHGSKPFGTNRKQKYMQENENENELDHSMSDNNDTEDSNSGDDNIINVKCEIFDENELRDEMQEEFHEEPEEHSTNSGTHVETDNNLQYQNQSESNNSFKRIRNQKTRTPNRRNSSASFNATDSLTTANLNQSSFQVQFQSTSTENNPQEVSRIGFGKSEVTVSIPTFSLGAETGIENVEDHECYPVGIIDPVNPARPRFCDKINKEGKICGGRLRFYNRRQKRKRDNTIQLLPTLRCSKKGCQKCFPIRNIHLKQEEREQVSLTFCFKKIDSSTDQNTSTVIRRNDTWNASQLHHNNTTGNVIQHSGAEFKTDVNTKTGRRTAKQCSRNLKSRKRNNPIDYGEYYVYIPNSATCRLCGEGVPRKHGNTTGLMVHLKNHHSIDLSSKAKQTNPGHGHGHDNPTPNPVSVSNLEHGPSYLSVAGNSQTTFQHCHRQPDIQPHEYNPNLPIATSTPISYNPMNPPPSSMPFQDHCSSNSNNNNNNRLSGHFNQVPGSSLTGVPVPAPTVSDGEDYVIVASKLGRKGQVKINYSEHFNFIISESGEEKAICKLCGKHISRKNCNTTSMRSHMFSLHKMRFPPKTEVVEERSEVRSETD